MREIINEFCKMSKINLVEDIQLSDNAFIEKNLEISHELQAFIQNIPYLNRVTDFQDHAVFNELANSNIILRVSYDKETHNAPNEVLRCAYLAMALSTLVDIPFEVGILSSYSNSGFSMGYSPAITRFAGTNDGSTVVSLKYQPELQKTFQFVFDSFRARWTPDNWSQQLLWSYISCVTIADPLNVSILNVGSGTRFGGLSQLAVQANILFERVFTNETVGKGGKWEKGIEHCVKRLWNRHFYEYQLVWHEVKVIRAFRTVVVHDNPINAQRVVDEWQNSKKLQRRDLLQSIVELVARNAKIIMRAIALNPDDYVVYQKERDRYWSTN